MADDPLIQSSQTLGEYEFLHLVGEGSAGVVYKARHLTTGRIVAIKLLPPQSAGSAAALTRLEREFRAVRNLDHPNIVRALAFCSSGGEPFLVMEFIDGESVGDKIERDGRMAEETAVGLVVQVCAGLAAAHQQGLVHRDIKPDNILVTRDGQVKVADFGLVRGADGGDGLTQAGRGLGTPHFMAPEQFSDAKNAGIRCDVYSIGATLYQMVTGRLPFESSGPLDAWKKKIKNDLTPPRQLVPTLTLHLDRIIRRSLSADPELRPASCYELADELSKAGQANEMEEPHDRANPAFFPKQRSDGALRPLLRRVETFLWLVVVGSAVLIIWRFLFR